MDKTIENLRKAIAGELQACARYLGFAGRADEEGFPGIARLFRAVSAAERVHAQSHHCALPDQEQAREALNFDERLKQAIAELNDTGAIQGTLENLQTAIDGETFEFKTMYPAMIRDAIAEKQLAARHSLEYAMSIEMIHAKLFKKALAAPEKNDVDTYHICPLCGYTVESVAPDKCPYCGVDKKKFHAVQ